MGQVNEMSYCKDRGSLPHQIPSVYKIRGTLVISGNIYLFFNPQLSCLPPITYNTHMTDDSRSVTSASGSLISAWFILNQICWLKQPFITHLNRACTHLLCAHMHACGSAPDNESIKVACLTNLTETVHPKISWVFFFPNGYGKVAP